MADDHQAQVDELLAEYRRSREELAAVHRKLATARESVTSDDGLVTATVGPQGALIDLEIDDRAYRTHRPAALARLIMDAAAEAAVRVARTTGKALEPVLPVGADPQALLAGTANLRRDEIAPPPPVDVPVAAQESFEHRTYLDSGGY